jgi:hypothetical protein
MKKISFSFLIFIVTITLIIEYWYIAIPILLILLIIALLQKDAVYPHTYIRGYWKKNGTYVSQHRRTKSGKNKNMNWSSKGNVNPFTGKRGYKK